MNVLVEPALEAVKFSMTEVAVQVAQVLTGLFHELRGVEIAERIGGEVADASHAPVDVLKAPMGVGGRRQLKRLLEFLVPSAGDVGRLQIAADQGLLQLETQDNVHVVGSLVGLHSNERRPNVVDGENEV